MVRHPRRVESLRRLQVLRLHPRSRRFALALPRPGQGGGGERFNPLTGRFEHFRHDPEDPHSLSRNGVTALRQDRQGTLWVGTQGGGLNRWRAADRQAERVRFERITRNDGLLSDIVYAILVDDDGRLWLSSDRGLTRFDAEQGTFDHFDPGHGLQSYEFNHGAAIRSDDGRLYFGGINGVSAFHPERVQTNTNVPPVIFTDFLKFNNPVQLDHPLAESSTIELDHRDSVIAFEFAALDFADPKKNRYQYKLEGFDHKWVDHGTRRRVTYTNSAAGDYTFHVRASNNDGVWNQEGAAVGLSIVPAPWLSWWSCSLYALLTAGGLLTFARAQPRKRQRARQLAAANLEAITKELVDLMAGEIYVDGAPGSGSHFWLVIEFAQQLDARDRRLQPFNGQAPRVLVVDDNQSSRVLLADRLRGWALDVVDVEDEASTLRALRGAAAADPFGLALIDQSLAAT